MGLTMTYSLAQQLKDNNFPGSDKWKAVIAGDNPNIRFGIEVKKDDLMERPTLSQLIEACGDKFWKLEFDGKVWRAFCQNTNLLIGSCKGSTPEEAVAKLWLELNKK